MKKYILTLSVLLTLSEMTVQSQVVNQPTISNLPTPSTPNRGTSTAFQKFLVQNYQDAGTLSSWQGGGQNSGVTRSTGTSSPPSFRELSYRHDMWASSPEQWSSIDSAHYEYAYNGLVTDLNSLMASENGWNNFVKISYTYTQDGKEVIYLNQSWNATTASWMNVSKFIYSYDNQNHFTSVASSVWNTTPGGWVHNDRYDYGYDSLGNRIAELYETWDAATGAWAFNYNHALSYDNNGHVVSYINQIWNDTNWVNTQKVIYAYSSFGSLSEKTLQTWSSGTWLNYEMNTWSFDGSNHLIETAGLLWNAKTNAWVNASKSDFTYDANNNNISETDYNWNAGSSQWSSSGYRAFTYNSDNYLLSEVDAVFNNGGMAYTSKYQNVYTSDNQRTSTTDFTWDNAAQAWIPTNAFNYGYDRSNNVIYQLNQTWSSANVEFQNSEQYYFYYTIVKATALDETANDFGAAIYPNPSQSAQVNLRLDVTDNSDMQLTVYDALGRPISTEIRPVIAGDNSITLGTSEMASGNYFVQMVDRVNGKTSVLKFVKL